jgi:hypothetical protein
MPSDICLLISLSVSPSLPRSSPFRAIPLDVALPPTRYPPLPITMPLRLLPASPSLSPSVPCHTRPRPLRTFRLAARASSVHYFFRILYTLFSCGFPTDARNSRLVLGKGRFTSNMILKRCQGQGHFTHNNLRKKSGEMKPVTMMAL